MIPLAKVWYEDPDGHYRKVCNELNELWKNGIVSAPECALGKQTAARCRDEAKAANKK